MNCTCEHDIDIHTYISIQVLGQFKIFAVFLHFRMCFVPRKMYLSKKKKKMRIFLFALVYVYRYIHKFLSTRNTIIGYPFVDKNIV